MIGEFFSLVAGFAYSFTQGARDKSRLTALEQYRAAQGYNRERQYELERMAYRDREAFREILGRNYSTKNDYEVDEALREIAEKEGWTFRSVTEELNDPVARRLMGRK